MDSLWGSVAAAAVAGGGVPRATCGAGLGVVFLYSRLGGEVAVLDSDSQLGSRVVVLHFESSREVAVLELWLRVYL